jgi:ribosomal protein S21
MTLVKVRIGDSIDKALRALKTLSLLLKKEQNLRQR